MSWDEKGRCDAAEYVRRGETIRRAECYLDYGHGGPHTAVIVDDETGAGSVHEWQDGAASAPSPPSTSGMRDDVQHPRGRTMREQRRYSALDAAYEAIAGERAASYGDANESFTRVADLWTVTLGQEVTPAQVVLCMIQLKVSRLLVTPGHVGSWTDVAEYAALGADITRES